MCVTGPFFCQVRTAPWVGDNDRLLQGGCSKGGSGLSGTLAQGGAVLRGGMGQALPRDEAYGLPAANHNCILILIPIHAPLAVIAGV